MPEEKQLNIYQRMLAVMKEVSYIQKDQNKIDGKYTAVKHDDVVGKIRPALIEHGIVTTVDVVSHEILKEWTVTNKYGKETRYTLTNVDIVVNFVSVDDPTTQQFSVRGFGYGIDNQDKGPGKAISYAVKYALLKNFSLETGDDPDNDQNSNMDVLPSRRQEVSKNGKPEPQEEYQEEEPPPTPRGELLSAKDLKVLHIVGKGLYGDDWDVKRRELCNFMTQGRTESSKELTVTEAKRMIDGMEKKSR